MIALMPYKNLSHALRLMRKQIIEGIPYAQNRFAGLSSPEQVWNALKPLTKFKSDPVDRELFQSLPTLLENNEHGTPGRGDCDCFTIAVLSVLLANGLTDCGIVLAGRSRFQAVHIWAYCDYKGKRYDLDLTQKIFNTTRRNKYPFTQSIPFVLTNTEKKMLLQLAEGGDDLVRDQPQYIWLPSRRVKVHEKVFDGMSAGEFQTMCLSEGVPIYELEQLSARRAERKALVKLPNISVKVPQQQRGASGMTVRQEGKAAKKAAKPRNVRKAVKQERKLVTAQGKAVKREAKGAAKITRADARTIKAQNPRSAPLLNLTVPQRPPAPYENPQQAIYQEPEFLPEDQYYQEEIPEQEYYQEEIPEQEIYQEEEVYQEESEPMEEGAGMLVDLLAIGGMIALNKFFIESDRRTA
jgi:hypothetical protein